MPRANETPKKGRTATKKAGSSRSAIVKKAAKKTSKTAMSPTTTQPKFPRHSVERSLRVPTAVYNQNGGNPVSPKEAASFVGSTSTTGNMGLEFSSARKYGFFESGPNRELVLTPRARRAIAPESPTDRVNALQEAVLSAPDISDVYNYYRGESLPDAEFFRNSLVNRFGIPEDKIDEFITVFYDSVRAAELLDESGERPRLVNAGRDESHQSEDQAPIPSDKGPSADGGGNCFVMQPFAAPLGGYYESIYRPAILQAGLAPIRADADIFGTGKIIEQIWRGINEAVVLVAELTTKNPNVFYELGLAHALAKPVVLVSSNTGDVPFDLQHIRVILYDMSDPFWGNKLIDKIADNIRSAITDPEDAIFRIEQTGS